MYNQQYLICNEMCNLQIFVTSMSVTSTHSSSREAQGDKFTNLTKNDKTITSCIFSSTCSNCVNKNQDRVYINRNQHPNSHDRFQIASQS